MGNCSNRVQRISRFFSSGDTGDAGSGKWPWWCLAIFFSILFLAIAGSPILFIHFRVIPHVEAKIEDARLDTFQFTTKQGYSVLSYNSSVALAIRNPNKIMRIRYTEPLVATFVFHGRRLTNVTVVDKGQKHAMRKTRVHRLHYTGDVPSSLLGAAAAEEFKKQKVTGLFKLEVHLLGEITYREVTAISMKRELRMSCPLNLQLAPPGPEVVVFQQVNCNSVEQDKIYF